VQLSDIILQNYFKNKIMEITLNSKDLRFQSKKKEIAEITTLDFNISHDIIFQSSKIVFVNNKGQIKILKERSN
jgi:hypothetical protein